MSGPDSHDLITSAVDALRRETDRLTMLGDALGRSESACSEQLRWLEERGARTERSRRRLAARVARWRRRNRKLPAATWQDAAASPRGEKDLEAELRLLRSQLAEAAGMLEAVRDARQDAEARHCREIEQLRAEAAQRGEAEGDEKVEELRRQLTRERNRSEELESQNASLATQLATSQVNGQISGTANSQSNESLSWEERKAAILRQLNREDHEEPLDASERESLREMVAKTDREIQRRDVEIAELQQLLEHQSTAVGDSVAVGAAAIAQMIDADDLVREEREKLQAIKAEWQDKLRQAEIDLSLERAKLARERRELERKNADLEDQLAQAASLHNEATATDQPRRRRWLTQLGISEGD